MRRIAWVLVLCALCVPAIWPLTQFVFFTSDDGLFHLYRLAALDDALHQGAWYPRLFPGFAFGYGQAVLNYYGPLSYYVAELPRLLGASYADALKCAFALGYIGSALAVFMLARRFVQPAAALLSAALYVYFPYHLAETYQRGALAEQWAFVFLPLILWAVTPHPAPFPAVYAERWLRRRGTTQTLILCASIAGLILTHTLTALIFLPFALIYALAMYWRSGATKETGELIVGFSASLLLTTFYWLPILVESRWVGLSAGLDNTGYLAHLTALTSLVQPSLLFQYPPHQIVSADHPLSPISLIVLVVMLAFSVVAVSRRDTRATPLILFMALAIIALFMMLDISSPVWTALHNPLSFLQYPWRFMTLLGLALAIGGVFAFASYARLAYAAVPIAVVVSVVALQPVPLSAAPANSEAMWQNDFQQRQIGATWTAEYMPWWVRADRTAIPEGNRGAVSEVCLPIYPIHYRSSGYDWASFTIPGASNTSCAQNVEPYRDSPETSVLRFHQFYLPQWRVTLGGTPLRTFPSTDLGLLSVLVPFGQPSCSISLDLQFSPTAIETYSGIVTFITLLGLLWYWRGWWLVPIGVAFITLSASLASSHVPAPNMLLGSDAHVQVANVARLLEAHSDRAVYHAGDRLQVTLHWSAFSETRENYKGFVHLTDANGQQVIAQSDGDPVGGYTPTSQWRLNEIITESRTLQIPGDAVAGTYRLYAGMYRPQPLQNLPATRDGQPESDGRIPLGKIQVDAR